MEGLTRDEMDAVLISIYKEKLDLRSKIESLKDSSWHKAEEVAEEYKRELEVVESAWKKIVNMQPVR